MSQVDLLKTKRFLPLFVTQFLGAFNNNVFKNALIVMITMGSINSSIDSALMINLCAGLFILPFFLFSPFAGVLADELEKSNMLKKLKLIEFFMIIVAIIGLYFKNDVLLLSCVFFLGIQAAFFGPIKYSILPQHLKEKELMAGNGLIESATFVAILMGTIIGGGMIAMENGVNYLSMILFCASIAGYLISRKIPMAQALKEKSKAPIYQKFIYSFKQAYHASKEKKSLFLSILAISWFWFLGATLLTQFPLIVKNILQNGIEHIDTHLITFLLVLFAIGIAVGSVACEKLSKSRIEIGLVPFGSFGMVISLIFFIHYLLGCEDLFKNSKLQDYSLWNMWIQQAVFIKMSLALFSLSVFSGFFTVPLYAFIQSRSDESKRSIMIGANNLWNSIFMVSSAVFGMIMHQLGFNLIDLLIALTVLHFIVSIYVFTVVPEFMMRFITWIFISTIYRIDTKGLEKLPEQGAGIIICNHVSFMDALFIFGLSPRPVKFVMYYKIFNIPFFKYMFNAVGAIPIASKIEDEKVFHQAFEKIDQYLKNGELVVIFPEGQITYDGALQEFKPGILKVLNKECVDVYPTAISGLFGSMFSRKDKGFIRYFPKAFFNHQVHFSVGDKLINPNLEDMKNSVSQLKLKD